MNRRCTKAKLGYSIKSPHIDPTLRQLLTEAGHDVPEVVTDADGETDIYCEEYRHEGDYGDQPYCGGCACETDQHMALIETI